MNDIEGKEIYDDIVFDYAAIRTNIFKTKFEEPKFWKSLGDVNGKNVLDLACGSGHYTRELKQKGANEVIGVDISREMIAEAKKCEFARPLGIKYYAGDASTYLHDTTVDIITAQYLFCYADSNEKLITFCNNVYRNIKPGGRLVTITTILEEKWNQEDMLLGYSFVPCPALTNDQITLYDGIQVNLTLYSGDAKSKCYFPNFLWKLETISSQLYSTGFTSVQTLPIFPRVPVIIIIATRGK